MNAICCLLLAATLVTNTNDSGPGSLREAIEAANERRTNAIAFAIPGDGPWHTIRLQSQLPPLKHFVQIDGATQRDTNPAGPEIEINGSALVSGNGLELENCGSVRGLVINGFPGNGLVLRGRCHGYDGIVERNYIGTDPTGLLAVPNQRGIWVDSVGENNSWPYFWEIRQNLISGNERSGVFIDRGKAHVKYNIIGLNVLLSGPLSNGASGVAIMRSGDGSDITDNYIGFNHHFGVAIAPETVNIRISGNSFQANHNIAIDRGINGVSPATDVEAPQILSVRYENGVTTIEASAAGLGNMSGIVSFYANDEPDPSGYGEGQYYLGSVAGRSSGNTAQTYTLRHKGDLRGKWIATTATRHNYFGWVRTPGVTEHTNFQAIYLATSEFSYAVEVK